MRLKLLLLLVFLLIVSCSVSAETAEEWYDKGYELSDLGKYEESITAFEKAIELDPPNAADSWGYIGRAYSKMNNSEESVRAYEKALELNPNDYYNLIFMAYGLEDLQKYEEAIAAREKAIALPKDVSDYDNIARDYEKLGNYQKVIDTYKRALVISPRDASIWGHIGETYEKIGEYQKAIDTFDECQFKGLKSCSIYCVPSMKETEDYKNSNLNSTKIVSDEVSNQKQVRSPPDYVQGELLVKYSSESFSTKDELTTKINLINSEIGAVTIKNYDSEGISGLLLIRLPSDMTIQEGIDYYQNISSVQYAEPNKVYTLEKQGTDMGKSTIAVNTPTPIPINYSPASSFTSNICDCSNDIYNCGDFPLPNGVSAQKCYEYCKSQGKGDIHGLDKDKNGVTCEGS
jgi:Tfp pilus assembly protein PilF